MTRRAPCLSLLALSIAFRLPALVNASAVNSDAAIVGLQAMHILRGEWSPLLFGSSYQTSVDSAVAALFFAAGGPTPLALMLSTLAGHVVLTLLVFAMLRRHVGGWTAFVLSLPLVLAPPSVHTYVLHPPRQASLTLALASFWALDRASSARRPLLAFGASAALAPLACFADPYALLFAPPAALFAAMCALDRAPARRALLARLGAIAAGAALGAIPLLLLWRYPGAKHGTTGITSAMLAHNWRLMVDTCLPWGLSYQAWVDRGPSWVPWSAPPAVHAVQLLGAIVLALAVGSGLALAPVRRIPWETRRIGVAGALACALTVVGFLGSVMVMDVFSTRYLAAFVLAAPLAMAPLAQRLAARADRASRLAGPARVLFVLAPYLASAALNGWLGFVPWTDGARIVRTDAGTAKDERALFDALRARGVDAAMADYWVSYRLTFLWREAIVVPPKNRVEDRYAPYVARFDRAPVVAYVFDPDRSREDRASIPEQLRARGVAFDHEEWLQIGRLTALVVRRAGAQ